jgi:hypothetical protein
MLVSNIAQSAMESTRPIPDEKRHPLMLTCIPRVRLSRSGPQRPEPAERYPLLQCPTQPGGVTQLIPQARGEH